MHLPNKSMQLPNAYSLSTKNSFANWLDRNWEWLSFGCNHF